MPDTNLGFRSMARFFKRLFNGNDSAKKESVKEDNTNNDDKIYIDSLKTGDKVDYEAVKERLKKVDGLTLCCDDHTRTLLCDEAEVAVVFGIVVRYLDMVKASSDEKHEYICGDTSYGGSAYDFDEHIVRYYFHLHYICNGKILVLSEERYISLEDKLVRLCDEYTKRRHQKLLKQLKRDYGTSYSEIDSHGELLRKYGDKRQTVLVILRNGMMKVFTANVDAYYSLKNPEENREVWVASDGQIRHDYYSDSYDTSIYMAVGGMRLENENALTAAQWFNELWGTDPSLPTPNHLLTDNNGKRVIGYEGDEGVYITIDNNISEVAPGAFDAKRYDYGGARDSKLKSVRMEGVSIIGSRAFADCGHLEEIYVSERLREVALDAFEGCGRIKKVVIPFEMEGYFSKLLPDFADRLEGGLLPQSESDGAQPDSDGVVISKSGHILIKCENRDITHYTVPDGVQVIWKYAFKECAYLRSITLPSSLKEIRFGAFECCVRLEEFAPPKDVKIEKYALGKCFSLPDETAKRFSNDIRDKTIEGRTLIGYTGNTELTRDVSSEYRSYTEIVLEEGYRTIKSLSGFWENAESVVLPSTLRVVEKGAFYLGHVEQLYIPDGVEVLMDDLRGCYMLRRLRLPSSLKQIDETLGKYCVSLRIVEIPIGQKEMFMTLLPERVRPMLVESNEVW